MQLGTKVNIIIPRRGSNPPEMIALPGLVVSEPAPGRPYVNKNTGATVQSQVVEVISLRSLDGRTWFQNSPEPVSLLGRRFGEPVPGLDVDENGQRIGLQALWGKVEQSLIELKLRQAANQTQLQTA